MKKYILSLLLLISSASMLHASESLEINLHAQCLDSKKEHFIITISSSTLYQSKDAVQDNTGGYVDIPEDKYYFKQDKDIYRLKGSVERSNEKNINQFTSHIYKESTRVLNMEELYKLKNSKNLQFIQKINLEYKSNNTTNIFNVHFDINAFEKEYKKCEEQIQKSTNTFYLQSIILLLVIFTILYFLRTKLRN